MFNFGACGLFAQTIDRILDASGDYIVLAGRDFDPRGDRACHHVGLRVGSWVVDGIGVSRIGPFLTHWRGTFEDMHEVRAPIAGGFLEAMRPRAQQLLDVAALKRDLVSLGVSSGMVQRVNPVEAFTVAMTLA